MKHFSKYYLLFLLLHSCGSPDHSNEFENMKSDLESAADNYCTCMENIDPDNEKHIEKCQEILHEDLILKCNENEIAKEFIHEKIRACVEERSAE